MECDARQIYLRMPFFKGGNCCWGSAENQGIILSSLIARSPVYTIKELKSNIAALSIMSAFDGILVAYVAHLLNDGR